MQITQVTVGDRSDLYTAMINRLKVNLATKRVTTERRREWQVQLETAEHLLAGIRRYHRDEVLIEGVL